jgi:hypothetical protein
LTILAVRERVSAVIARAALSVAGVEVGSEMFARGEAEEKPLYGY